MSIKSTVELSKGLAIKYIVRHHLEKEKIFLEHQLEQVSNEVLEDTLEKIDESTGNIYTNYIVREGA